MTGQMIFDALLFLGCMATMFWVGHYFGYAHALTEERDCDR